MTLTLDDLLGRVAGLAPLIEREAAAGEQLRHTPPVVAEALIDAGLFKLLVPGDYGGSETPLPDALRVMDAVSAIDGGTGWTVMIGAGGGPFAAYMDPLGAAEVFGPREAVIAGSGAPRGVARETEGGYIATGRWSYASGAHHASWFTANCTLQDRDGNSLGSEEAPAIRAMAFPAAEVDIIDAWDPVGMRSTGSHDFAVHEVFVPRERTFSVFTDTPNIKRTLYAVPFIVSAGLTMGAVGLGIARHAIAEFQRVAPGKRPGHAAAMLADMPSVHLRVAEAEALSRSAAAFFYDVADSGWARLEGGGSYDDEAVALAQLASVHAVLSAGKAVDLLRDAAGMTPVPQEAVLGRCWRDVHTLSQNALVSPLRMEDAGRALVAARHLSGT